MVSIIKKQRNANQDHKGMLFYTYLIYTYSVEKIDYQFYQLIVDHHQLHKIEPIQMFINGRVDVKLGITTREIYIALKIDLKYTETYSNMDKS